jgi:hypothetical protein
MAVSNQPCFVSPIMLDIKDKVDTYLLVSYGCFDLGMVTFINEGVIVIDLGEL